MEKEFELLRETPANEPGDEHESEEQKIVNQHYDDMVRQHAETEPAQTVASPSASRYWAAVKGFEAFFGIKGKNTNLTPAPP